MHYRDVIEHTIAHGGGMFDPRSLQPLALRQGYAVTRHNCAATLPLDDLDADVLSYYLSANGGYLCTWLRDGIVQLDRVDIFERAEAAWKAAQQRGSQAVFDFSRQAEWLVLPAVPQR